MIPALNLSHLILLGMLCTALHWLLARSYILKWFWSRLDGTFVGHLLACAACSGFWLGVVLGWFGLRPATGLHPGVECMIAGLLGLYLTPIFEAALLWGLRESTLPEAEEAPLPPHGAIPQAVSELPTKPETAP